MENTYPGAPLVAGPLYAYTSHLMQLQNFMLLLGPQIPGPLLGGSSPLRTEAFKAALKHHPDRQHRDYIIIGLAEGFRVGFDHRQPLR